MVPQDFQEHTSKTDSWSTRRETEQFSEAEQNQRLNDTLNFYINNKAIKIT